MSPPGGRGGGRKGAGGRGGGGSAGGARVLRQRVKTARGRKTSSTRWIDRQLNDPYVHRARAEGYRSRAAYKLIEIDDRHRLLAPGMRVVDLGAAPGGWSQVAARRVGSTAEAPRVVAIDRLDMDPVEGVVVLKKDFLDEDAPAAIAAALGGAKAGAVLSDLAAETTGHRPTDHLRTMHLAEVAYDFARRVLAPDGCFLAKVFQGGSAGDLLAALRRDFRTVKHVKPAASRAESVELYVLATGFRGTAAEGGTAPRED